MRIPCPLCGPRDRREFYYYGTPDYLDRPADLDALDNQLFLRDNPAGETRDLWYHENGCGSWLLVSRNTVTHAISSAEMVMDRAAATFTTTRKTDTRNVDVKTTAAKPKKGA